MEWIDFAVMSKLSLKVRFTCNKKHTLYTLFLSYHFTIHIGMDKKQCILVGHDWGGSVGYGFCATYPEMVSCFIVCNLPHPQSIRHEQANSWKQRLMSWYMLFFQCPTIPEFFFTHDDYALLDEIVKEQKASNHEEIAEAYKYAFKDQSEYTSFLAKYLSPHI